MQKMLRVLGDRRAALQNGEETQKGFTLIELLVVVIIIGILAGIAIPVFLNQRTSAWQAELETDVRNAALAIETWAIQEGGSYGDLADDTLAGEGWVASSDSVSVVAAPSTDGLNFTVVGTHTELDETVTYNSALGGIVEAP